MKRTPCRKIYLAAIFSSLIFKRFFSNGSEIRKARRRIGNIRPSCMLLLVLIRDMLMGCGHFLGL